MSQQYPPPPPQYPQYPQYPPPAPSTSTAAIIGLIASILAFFMFPIIGSIVGIVAGNSAKTDIRNRPGQVTGEGIAQAAVVLGWIGLGLWALGLCGFLGLGGLGFCAALMNGEHSSSILPMLPLASVIMAPIYLILKH